jgi:hypothetical protein
VVCVTAEVHSQIDTTGLENPEEVILKFSYERVLESVIFAYYYKNEMYVPLESIFRILLINVISDESASKLYGFYISPEDEYEIDFKNLQAVFRNRLISFNKDEILVSGKSICLLPGLIKKIFGLNFVVNMNNLTLSLSTAEKLPVVTKIERENKREFGNMYTKVQNGPLLFKRNRRFLNGGFFDYSLSLSYANASDPFYNYDFSLGSELFGGELNAFTRGSFPNLNSDDNNVNSSFQWKYTLNKNKILTQISAGNLISNGLNSLNFNGLTLTNTPSAPRISYTYYTVFEKTIPNSDVEIYLNNLLYDYKKSDESGNVSFQVPLNYGSSIIYLKIYGPNGELLENNKRIQIPLNFLPQGEVNYNVSAGKKTGSGEFITSANIFGGITDWITDNAGVDYIKEPLFNKPLFYNSFYARFFTDYLFSYTFAPDLYHNFSFYANYYSLLSYSLTYSKYKENQFYNQQKLNDNAQLNALIPFTFGDIRTNTQITGSYSKFPEDKIYSFDIIQGFDFSGFHPFIDYKYNKFVGLAGNESINQQISAGFLTSVPYLNNLFQFLSGNLLSAKLDYDASEEKVSNFNLSFSANVSSFVRIQFNFDRNILANNTDFSMQISMDFSSVRVFNTLSHNSVSSLVQGSLGYDATNKGTILLYNKQKTGTGGATFRMFIDKNGNGRYDEGEELVKGVNLYMHQVLLIEKGSDEIIRVSDLIPNMEYSVEIKDENQPVPMLVPLHRKFSFTADPNGYKRIDIPFYYSAEISGKVTTVSNSKTLDIPGLRVIIKNTETNEITTATTYADGSFYCTGLLPGIYKASLSPEDLRNYRAEPNYENYVFEIKPKSTGEGISDINFAISF